MYKGIVPSLVSGKENEAFPKVEPTPNEEGQVDAKRAAKELLERAMDSDRRKCRFGRLSPYSVDHRLAISHSPLISDQPFSTPSVRNPG